MTTEEQDQKRMRIDTTEAKNDVETITSTSEVNIKSSSSTVGQQPVLKTESTVQNPLPTQAKQKQNGKSQKKLYAPGLQVIPCDRFAILSVERRFKCRYTVPPLQPTNDGKFPSTIVLDALVLDNNISVLCLPYAMKVVSFSHSFEVDMSAIVGKFKRGSRAVHPLDEIAKLNVQDENNQEHVIRLLSPIEGKVSEQNMTLVQEPSLLQDQFRSDGHIAVLVSEAPSIISKLGPNLGLEFENESKAKDRVCFAWAKGNCARGNHCKFKHTQPNIDVNST